MRVLLVGQDREQAREGVAEVRGDADRQVDRDHEHDAHQDGHDLLEDLVLVEPDEDQADQSGQDGPPLEVHDVREERLEGQARRGHGRGAVDEAPDHDVHDEEPRRPAAQARPAVEERAAGGQVPAARRLGERDLDETADDGGPQERVAEVACPRSAWRRGRRRRRRWRRRRCPGRCTSNWTCGGGRLPVSRRLCFPWCPRSRGVRHADQESVKRTAAQEGDAVMTPARRGARQEKAPAAGASTGARAVVPEVDNGHPELAGTTAVADHSRRTRTCRARTRRSCPARPGGSPSAVRAHPPGTSRGRPPRCPP